MDDYDISNIYNPFAFFVLCPILIFIWDFCHYNYRKENSDRECTSEENSITPLEEIQSDSIETESENTEESGNRDDIDLLPEEQQGDIVQEDTSQEDAGNLEASQRNESDLSSSNHSQSHAESWHNNSSPGVESTCYEPTQVELWHGSEEELTSFNQSQEESSHGISSREESTSFNQSHGEVFHPREVLDSSRIENSNAVDSNTENRENYIPTTSISPIAIVNRGRAATLYGLRRAQGGPEKSPKRAANAIYPIFEDKMHKIEDLRNMWQMVKEMENPSEDARQLINDVLQQCNIFMLSKNVISLRYYLQKCKEDKDNFSESVTTDYLYDSWWKIHEMLGQMEDKFKSLCHLKKQTESEKKKNREISADSPLLRETQSYTVSLTPMLEGIQVVAELMAAGGTAILGVYHANEILEFFYHLGIHKFAEPDGLAETYKRHDKISNLIILFTRAVVIGRIFFNLSEKSFCQAKQTFNDERYLCGLLVPCWFPFKINMLLKFWIVAGSYLILGFYLPIAAVGYFIVFGVSDLIVLRMQKMKRMLEELDFEGNEEMIKEQLLECIEYHFELWE